MYLLGAGQGAEHYISPMQLNRHLNSRGKDVSMMPTLQMGNWGSENIKGFVQTFSDKMARLEIGTKSLGEIWASSMKSGEMKKLSFFLLTY